jgi:hypothetical protein
MTSKSSVYFTVTEHEKKLKLHYYGISLQVTRKCSYVRGIYQWWLCVVSLIIPIFQGTYCPNHHLEIFFYYVSKDLSDYTAAHARKGYLHSRHRETSHFTCAMLTRILME